MEDNFYEGYTWEHEWDETMAEFARWLGDVA